MKVLHSQKKCILHIEKTCQHFSHIFYTSTLSLMRKEKAPIFSQLAFYRWHCRSSVCSSKLQQRRCFWCQYPWNRPQSEVNCQVLSNQMLVQDTEHAKCYIYYSNQATYCSKAWIVKGFCSSVKKKKNSTSCYSGYFKFLLVLLANSYRTRNQQVLLTHWIIHFLLERLKW